MSKFVWRLKSYQIPLFISKTSMLATDFLRSLLCNLHFCSHEDKRKKTWLVQIIWAWTRNFPKKKYSSLRFAMWNQNAILFHHHLFPLVANHKKVTLLGSQKERRKEIRKQTVQTKCYKLSKQYATNNSLANNKQHYQTVQTTSGIAKLNQTNSSAN